MTDTQVSLALALLLTLLIVPSSSQEPLDQPQGGESGAGQGCVLRTWGNYWTDPDTGTKCRSRSVQLGECDKATKLLDCIGKDAQPGPEALSHCIVTAWGRWAPFSGTTYDIRTRSPVNTVPTDISCPRLAELRPNVVGGVIDCELSQWSVWQFFPLLNQQARFREILVEPRNGGLPCGPTFQIGNIDRDCVLGIWSLWSIVTIPPNNLCFKQRTRSIVAQPSGNGAPCDGLSESLPCDDGGTQDCVVTQWSLWTVYASNPVFETRFRTIVQDASGTGAACPPDLVAFRQRTSDDCVFTPWANWVEVGGVQCTRYRARSLLSGSSVTCVPTFERVPCDDCVMGPWSPWLKIENEFLCVSRRTRDIISQPPNAVCPIEVEENDCVDCVWDLWGAWRSFRTEPCQEARFRERRIVGSGGAPCDGETIDIRICGVDCVWDLWGAWRSFRTEPCQEARFRERRIVGSGGAPCDGETIDIRICGVDCVWDLWGAWRSYRTEPCQEARFRERRIVGSGGAPCDGETIDIRICGAVGCQYTAWQAWTRWSTDAGQTCLGLRQRTIISPTDGSCTDTIDTQPCVDCKWGVWSEWETLSISPCRRQRSRTHNPPITGVGLPCDGDAVVVENCGAVGCQYNPWTAWSRWSSDGGQTCLGIRSRTVISPTDGSCTDTIDTQTCVDCKWTVWSAWEILTTTPCRRRRTRTQDPPVSGGGLLCDGDALQIEDCTPVGCQYNAWEAWARWSSDSGQTCLGIRSRTIISPTDGSCQDTIDTQPCVDCKWSGWSAWQSISTSPCRQQRSRTNEPPATGVGLPCDGDATEIEDCTPVGCQYNAWAAWSRWSSAGSQTCLGIRTRTVISPTDGSCTDTVQTQTCVDCKWTVWSAWQSISASPCRQRRSRTHEPPVTGIGLPCDGDATEIQDCPIVGCQYNPWGAWSRWSSGGSQTCLGIRSRTVISPNDGSCTDTIETQTCVDCKWSVWLAWQSLSTSPCREQRSRTHEPPVTGFGLPCDGDATEIQDCPIVGCQYNVWQTWNRWSSNGGATCLGIRTRTIISPTDGSCTDTIDTQSCVDCKWGVWSNWESFSISPCRQQRSRTHIPPATGLGLPCDGDSTEIQNCEADEIDCVFSLWSDWIQITTPNCLWFRSRTVTTPAKNGGAACPSLFDTKDCGCLYAAWGNWQRQDGLTCTSIRARSRNPTSQVVQCTDLTETIACVDCDVAMWGPWDRTSVEPCLDQRTRVITVPLQFGGNACPALTETQPCGVNNCEVGQWTSWIRLQEPTCRWIRARDVLQSTDGGSACPPLIEERACGCLYTEWGLWTRQSGTTGCNAFRIRSRDPESSVLDCDETVDVQPCVDCTVTNWSLWASVNINPCRESRARAIATPPQNGGNTCPELTENRECGAQNCEVEEWSSWIQITMGGCQWVRIREITREPGSGGTPCPDIFESKPCDCLYTEWAVWRRLDGVSCVATRSRSLDTSSSTTSCTELSETRACADCQLTDFSEWTRVSENPCQEGRVRTITTAPTFGGNACPTLSENRNCGIVNCEVSTWSVWTLLSQTSCLWVRSRQITVQPQNNGLACPDMFKTKPCDCTYTEWGPWGRLSGNTCTATRSRTVQSIGSPSGSCTETTDVTACVDCTVTQWSPWAQLPSSPCRELRLRSVITGAEFGGNVCPDLTLSRNCGVTDCELSQWTPWFQLSNPCRTVRVRDILVQPGPGGEPCPDEIEEIPCGSSTDCAYTAWGNWMVEGTATCFAIRTRSVVNPSDSATCSATTETQTCVHCTVSIWNPWIVIPSSNPCRELRTRSVLVAALAGGNECPPISEERFCGVSDCQVSPWNMWTVTPGPPCRRSRIRTILSQPGSGGTACPDLLDVASCGTEGNCDVIVWSAWTLFSNPCRWLRFRMVSSDPSDGSEECPERFERKECGTTAVNCVVSTWGTWSLFSNPCRFLRFRTITTQPSNGGEECPERFERKDCGCKYTTWGPWAQQPQSNSCFSIRVRQMDPTSTVTSCDDTIETATCVNCEVNLWMPWVPLTSNPCTQRRIRTASVQPLYGGNECPPLVENADCGETLCEVTEWGVWISLANPCQFIRLRTVTQQPSAGAAPCPELHEVKPCECSYTQWSLWFRGAGAACNAVRTRDVVTSSSTTDCTDTIESSSCVDCDVSEWSLWSRISQDPCMEIRTRTVTVDAVRGGNSCPLLRDDRDCGAGQCEVGDWSPWSPTSTTSCLLIRVRVVTKDGENCPAKFDTKPCVCSYAQWGPWTRQGGSDCTAIRTRQVDASSSSNNCTDTIGTVSCVDCRVSNWTSWFNVNDNPCEDRRQRTIITAHQFGGNQCPVLSETKPCVDVNCEVSNWGVWTLLANPCQWVRVRVVTQEPQVGGMVCPILFAIRQCDCVYTAWSLWLRQSSERCFAVRVREVDPSSSSNSCPDVDESITCVDCNVTQWGPWAPWQTVPSCNEQRARSVIAQAQNGGNDCPPLIEQRTCDGVDCEVDQWSAWVLVQNPCQWVRVRTVTVQQVGIGAACPIRFDQKPCGCVYSTWGPWARQLNFECASIRTRTRDAASSPGSCPDTVETHSCVDCAVDEWTPWENSQPDPCIQTRSRSIITLPEYGGNACPGLSEVESCEPVECTVHTWGTWVQFQNPCQWIKVRNVIIPPGLSGNDCPSGFDSKPCVCAYTEWTNWVRQAGANCLSARMRQVDATTPLPTCGETIETSTCVDCLVDQWDQWAIVQQSPCLERRTRSIIVNSEAGGNPCPELTDDRPCDCSYSNWGPWVRQPSLTGCVAMKTRTVITGNNCPETTETVTCISCQTTFWTIWTRISLNPCTETRSRTITQQPEFGGGACPLLTEEKPCADVDCQVSDWGNWVVSQNPCMRLRVRTVRVEQQNNGQPCPPLFESVDCGECEYSTWEPWVRGAGSTCIAVRVRTITVDPDGVRCNDRTITAMCVDCEWSLWTVWTRISTNPCREERTRFHNPPASSVGLTCVGDVSELQGCIIECRYGIWSDWRRAIGSSCLAERTRPVLNPSTQICAATRENDFCVDCVWSGWSLWTIIGNDPCREERIRFHNPPASGVGFDCVGDVVQEQDCNVDCVWGAWSPWEIVSLTPVCAQRRIRARLRLAEGPGLPCTGDAVQFVPCPVGICEYSGWTEWFRLPGDDCLGQRQRNPIFTPSGEDCTLVTEEAPCVDCVWGVWTSWQVINPSPCQERRSRSPSPPGSGVGLPCVGVSIQEDICIPCPRPVDIVVVVDTSTSVSRSKMVELKSGLVALLGLLDFNFIHVGICYFGSVEETIADIEPARSKQQLQNIVDASQPLRGSTISSLGLECANRQFNMSRPDVEDYLLLVMDGNPADPPDTEAEKALTIRIINDMKARNIFVFSIAIGNTFEDVSEIERWATVDDNLNSMFIHAGTFAEFNTLFTNMIDFEILCPFPCQYTAWAPWERRLDNGECVMVRSRDVTQRPAGQNCGDTEMAISCVDCAWSPWSRWIEVSLTPCRQSRFRVESTAVIGLGVPCQGDDFEDRDCVCEYAEWSLWQPEITIDGCKQVRTRDISFQPESEPICPDDEERRVCSGNCVVSTWGTWETTGPGGCMQRFRQILQNPNNEFCPPLMEEKDVTPPIHCVVSGWLDWERLSGQGIERRVRRILIPAENGGEPCPSELEQTRNIDVDCIVSQWVEWKTAPSSLTFTRQRYILVSPHNNGILCPTLTDSKPVLIPVDCQVGIWGPWTREFDFTYFERTRVITRDPTNGGMPCPKLFDLRGCNENQGTSGTASSIIENLLKVAPQDLLIIMDSSSSVNLADYQVMKDFVSFLLDIMCGTIGLGVNQNRIALMHYSTSAHTVLEFSQSSSLNQVKTVLQAMDKEDFTTCTGDALRHALLNVLLPSKGMRDPSVAPTHVLIMTDGCTNCGVDDLLAAADMRDVAEIFGMPIGEERSACFDRLLTYASLPKYTHMFPIDDINEFNNIIVVWESMMSTQNICLP